MIWGFSRDPQRRHDLKGRGMTAAPKDCPHGNRALAPEGLLGHPQRRLEQLGEMCLIHNFFAGNHQHSAGFPLRQEVCHEKVCASDFLFLSTCRRDHYTGLRIVSAHAESDFHLASHSRRTSPVHGHRLLHFVAVPCEAGCRDLGRVRAGHAGMAAHVRHFHQQHRFGQVLDWCLRYVHSLRLWE